MRPELCAVCGPKGLFSPHCESGCYDRVHSYNAGAAHGRADLEARCQQARAQAYSDAAHLLRCAMSLHGVAAGSVALATLEFLTASPTTVFVSPAATVEAMRPATTVAGALKPVAFVQREPAPAPARVAPVDDARRLLGELVAGIDSFQDDADNGIADDMRRVTTMNAALEAARAYLASHPPSTAPAEQRDATAADVKAALERKHPECRVLEDPVLQDSGLWVALVALTPWGPLVRVEVGVVSDAQVSAAVAREKAGAT